MDLLQELLFLVFQADGKLDIASISRLADKMATGIEGITCSYNPDDEDYREGYVTIDYWLGREDETRHVEKSKFYDALSNLCNNHLDSNPEDGERVLKCLSKIKCDLKNVRGL